MPTDSDNTLSRILDAAANFRTSPGLVPPCLRIADAYLFYAVALRSSLSKNQDKCQSEFAISAINRYGEYFASIASAPVLPPMTEEDLYRFLALAVPFYTGLTFHEKTPEVQFLREQIRLCVKRCNEKASANASATVLSLLSVFSDVLFSESNTSPLFSSVITEDNDSLFDPDIYRAITMLLNLLAFCDTDTAMPVIRALLPVLPRYRNALLTSGIAYPFFYSDDRISPELAAIALCRHVPAYAGFSESELLRRLSVTESSLLTYRGIFLAARAAVAAVISEACVTGDKEAAPSPLSYPAEDEHCHFAFLSGKQRTAGFVYREDNAPFLGFYPTDCTDFLHSEPLFNHIVFADGRTLCRPERHNMLTYKGGFLVYGETTFHIGDLPFSDDHIAPCAARSAFAMAILPDDETVLILEEAHAALPANIASASALSYSLPPTEAKRLFYYDDVKKHISPKPSAQNCGRYINIEDKLGIVADAPMTLEVTGGGDVHIAVSPLSDTFAEKNQLLYRVAAAAAVGGIRRTRALSETFLTLDALPEGVRAVSCVAANRKRYTLLYNLSDTTFSWNDRIVESGEAVLLAWDR